MIIYILMGLLALLFYPRFKSGLKFSNVQTWLVTRVFSVFVFGHLQWFLGYIGLPFYLRISLILIPLLFLLKRDKFVYRNLWRDRKELFLIEGIGIILFGLFLLLRFFYPDIFSGEKPMDFSLLSFFERTDNYYGEDPWASNSLMKYYYWGYYIYGSFCRFDFLGMMTSYHGLIAWNALSFYFSMIFFFLTLKRSLKWAILGALSISFMPNLETWKQIFTGQHINFASFWNSTRVFRDGSGPVRFAEFPVWSHIFADYHPHVMNYPLLILTLGFAIQWYRAPSKKLVFQLSYLIATLFVVSTWDVFPILILFTIFLFEKIEEKKFWISFKTLTPFILTPFWHFFILYPILTRGGKGIRVNEMYSNNYKGIMAHEGLWIIMIGLLCFGLIRIFKIKIRKESILMAQAVGVLFLMAEFLIVQDTVNTTFKFYNIIFIMMGLITYQLMSLKDSKKYFQICCCLSFFLCLPSINLVRGYLGLNITQRSEGLSSQNLLHRSRPRDAFAIRWINQNIKGDAGIVEIAGESFSRNGRISQFTGLRNIVNWNNHVLIRGLPLQEYPKRIHSITLIYTTRDVFQAIQEMRSYNMKYLYIGHSERQAYKNTGLEKFKKYPQYFKEIYKDNHSQIFQIL